VQLTPAQVVARSRELVVEFGRQLALRGRRVATEVHDDRLRLVVTEPAGPHVLEFAPVAAWTGAPTGAEVVLVAVTADDGAIAHAPPTAAAIGLDPPRLRGALGPLGSAFREFLRKRGVRLHPRTWTYGGGWL
jgi:hypothetical protein